jgi:hypothetical protein
MRFPSISYDASDKKYLDSQRKDIWISGEKYLHKRGIDYNSNGNQTLPNLVVGRSLRNIHRNVTGK